MSKVSAFARALSDMNPDERARAHRLRDALRLREDDAVWEFCAIAKGFDKALRDIPTKCSEAAEHVARSEFGARGGGGGSAVATCSAGGPLFVMTLVSLFVAGIVAIGSAGFTVGTIVQNGSVPWMPADIASRGVVSYVATATLTAPVGGLFAFIAVLELAGVVVAVRWWHSRRGA